MIGWSRRSYLWTAVRWRFMVMGLRRTPSCQFGDVAVAASHYKDDLVACEAPPLAPGAYATTIVLSDVSSSRNASRRSKTGRSFRKTGRRRVKWRPHLNTGRRLPVRFGGLCAFDRNNCAREAALFHSVSCAAPSSGKAGFVQVRVGFSPQTLSDTSDKAEVRPGGRVSSTSPRRSSRPAKPRSSR